jgi:hypothetical protein
MKRKSTLFTALAALAVVVSVSHAATTNTFGIGGSGARDMEWTDGTVTNTGVSPTEYSLTFGAPLRYPALSNVAFTVTVSETNDVMFLRNVWLGGTNGHVSRLDGDEAVRIKVSYSDPDNKLLELGVAGIGSQWNTLSHETLVFSDGANSYSMTDTENDAIVDYDTTGLDQLTLANTGSWSLLVTVDDTLGGGTNFTESGMGAFVLGYVADVEEVEEYSPLEPVLYEFLGDSEFDNKSLSANATMTRSNSWGSAVTITTVNIIGQDGSSATNGVNHKTNIYSTLNALGINDAKVTGSEYQDFNPGEAWQFTFSEDVYLVEMYIKSQNEGAELTVSSDEFAPMVLADGQAGDIHNLSNVFVSAGTVVTWLMSSPTNAADTGLRIGYLEIQVPSDVNSYDAWIQDQGLIKELNDGLGDDPDLDGLDNLMEYAFGGNALSNDAAVYGPGYEFADDGGTTYMNYAYRRRFDRVAQGLTYDVGSSANLVADAVTNATEEAGSVAIDSTYESVTNRVSTDAADAQFMQLKVTAE